MFDSVVEGIPVTTGIISIGGPKVNHIPVLYKLLGILEELGLVNKESRENSLKKEVYNGFLEDRNRVENVKNV